MSSTVRVEAVMDQVEQRLCEAVEFADIVSRDSVLVLLATGKRLRARIVVETALARKVTGRDQNSGIIVSCAAAVELVHLASLIHDDLIDKAEQRRGAAALHTVLGQDRAILIGNVLMAKGILLASEASARSGFALASAVDQLNRGQLLERDLSLGDPQGFLTYISLKTAALLGAAAEIGAIVADHDESQIRHLATFGWNFGMMFQMIDDLCDFAGSEVAMKKPVHQDLANRVFTVPIQNAVLNEPTLVALIGQQSSTEAYERMHRAVDWGVVTDHWHTHAEAARANLVDALGKSSPAWLRGISEEYSLDALRANSIPVQLT